MSQTVVDQLNPEQFEAHIPELSDILHACVLDGASVNFVQPFERADAERFWRGKLLPVVRNREALPFVGRSEGDICGLVVLFIGMPPNQAHRAEVGKLLVPPTARRNGVARQLMFALEREAKAQEKTLITLDTKTGDPAETLYLNLGYQKVGEIPQYAISVDGTTKDTVSYFYKILP